MSFFVRRTNIARATLLLYASYASHVPIASNILSFSVADCIGFFCQVDRLVMEFVEEARKVPLPVTRATIQSLGVAARDELSAVVLTSADDKNNLEMFGASEKLVRNFLLRHGMSSTVLHGEAGSVDVESIAEGMEAIRLACLDYDMETSSTSTRQASSSCFCRSARPCQQQRTGRRRGVRTVSYTHLTLPTICSV